jgi:hypothetical protein
VNVDVDCPESLALGPGVLRLLCRSARPDAYDAGGPAPVFWLEFQVGETSLRMGTVDQIPGILAEAGCPPGALAEALAADPGRIVSLAVMLGRLLYFGRVVTLPELYGFLEGLFHVDLQRCLPELEGGRLRFTTVTTREMTVFVLRHVWVDLSTMERWIEERPGVRIG